MPVEDVKRLGRSTQGVIVMRLRGDETVSALAPVVDSEDDEQQPPEAADASAEPEPGLAAPESDEPAAPDGDAAE
jgi:hypothetical protein